MICIDSVANIFGISTFPIDLSNDHYHIALGSRIFGNTRKARA